jgi:hypothetical protein
MVVAILIFDLHRKLHSSTKPYYEHSYNITIQFVQRCPRCILKYRPSNQNTLTVLPWQSCLISHHHQKTKLCTVPLFLSSLVPMENSCVVCSSSIYGFWLPLWYLQTLLMNIKYIKFKIMHHNVALQVICESWYIYFTHTR